MIATEEPKKIPIYGLTKLYKGLLKFFLANEKEKVMEPVPSFKSIIMI